MPLAGFEPTISAGERPQTYALDSAVTGTGTYGCIASQITYGFVTSRIPWHSLTSELIISFAGQEIIGFTESESVHRNRPHLAPSNCTHTHSVTYTV